MAVVLCLELWPRVRNHALPVGSIGHTTPACSGYFGQDVSCTLPTIEAPLYADSPTSTIAYWAQEFGANATEMAATIQCESHGNSGAVGDNFTSYGLVQIHLPAHLDITKEQALNPDWSLEWMAKQWNSNKRIWSCARLLGYAK